MGLNRALVGKAYPPVELVADAERVLAFARAVGHPGGDVPPTFVTVPEIAAGLANAVADPDLGLELSRVLHGEQQYEWYRPLTVGETVTVEATIADIRGRAALEFLTLRTEMRDEAAELVCVGRSTVIVRGEP